MIFLFFTQIIAIVIMIKLKKPNYYKLLLLLNVTKCFFYIKKVYYTLQKIIFNVYIIIDKNKVIIVSRWV